jgi:hypothetical protein
MKAFYKSACFKPSSESIFKYSVINIDKTLLLSKIRSLLLMKNLKI